MGNKVPECGLVSPNKRIYIQMCNGGSSLMLEELGGALMGLHGSKETYPNI